MSKATIAAAAAIQIERFVRLGFTPVPTDELRSELRDTFKELARDGEHVKQIGDLLVRTKEYFPRPKDIVDAIEAIAEQSRQPKDWDGHSGPPGSFMEEGWFFNDLSQRPDMIAKWQWSRAHSPYRHAREFATKLLDQLSGYMGEAL